MRNETGFKNDGRKVWIAPKLQVIKAGSAEQGGVQNIPDGGPTSSPRS